MRTSMNIMMSARQIGQGCPLALMASEQLAQAKQCPQGTAACDLEPVKQMAQVVPPPMVDVSSGCDGRPRAAAVGAITMGC